jgi:cytochrome d ubiquinol oxidase subunit I
LGRYPWVVYGVLTIADAVSPNVSTTSLLISNILYFATFATLGGIMIFLSRRVLLAFPKSEESTEEKALVDPFSAEAFDQSKKEDK